jgi:hypothetical protein
MLIYCYGAVFPTRSKNAASVHEFFHSAQRYADYAEMEHFQIFKPIESASGR